MNIRLALLAFSLNSVFLANTVTAIRDAAYESHDLMERMRIADHRGIESRFGRQARTRLYSTDNTLDELIDATPEIIDHTAYGMSVFEPEPVNDLWQPMPHRHDIVSQLKAMRDSRHPHLVGVWPGTTNDEIERMADEILAEHASHEAELDNVLTDVDEEDDLRLNVDDMRCAVEQFDQMEDREYAPGLYS